MAVRLKEWMIPYTWWDGIEITDNHVINVLLRAANNLIQVNDDREIYVDLQLPAGIAPDDVFPVGITTWEILAEDWWQQSGTIINSKTTSWDYVRLIYANDGNLYYDPWTWQWIMIGTSTAIDVNTKTFFIYNENSQETDLTLLAAVDYYKSGKNPLICYKNQIYTLQRVFDDLTEDGFMDFTFINAPFIWTATNGKRDEQTETLQPFYIRWINFRTSQWEIENLQFATIDLDDYLVTTTGNKAQTITWTKTFDVSPVVPSKSTAAGNNPTSIATEAQVYLKQDKLTAWSWISIDSTTNTISANVQGALVFKGSVADVASLPSSWNTIWDTYYVIADGAMYSWDWTQWISVGNTQIDLTNYFDTTTDTTDDITEWSTNLFVTSAEKTAWDGKQNALTAGTNITINNWVISATDTTYSAGTWIWITGTTISNTLPFNPENAGTVWQVLKRTSTWVRWGNEMSVKWASFSAFLNMCTTNWSKHTSTIRKYSTYGSADVWEASYTVQGYWWFNYYIKSGAQTQSTAKVKLNWVEIDSVYSPSSAQSTDPSVSSARFITVWPEDVITVSLDKYAWEANAEIIDYY